MPTEKKYDVAISFRSGKETVAKSLYDELSKNLRVFVYFDRQAELAGRDGLEVFGNVFRKESLLNVILFSDGWGQTPWTGVEAAAIKDSCLKTSFENLVFVQLDDAKMLPEWVPDTHLRFII